MVRSAFPLVVLAVATALAACQAQPTGPVPHRTFLLDSENPECVDTVYQDSTEETSNSRSLGTIRPGQGTAMTGGCHVVIVYY